MIRDPVLWETVWDRLERKFALLAGKVRECSPEVHWQCGRSGNEAFPFRAYASFVLGDPAVDDEDVVISVDCFRSGPTLWILSDISQGNGYVLADGPGARLSLGADMREIGRETLTTVHEIELFLEERLDLLLRELC